MQAKKVSAYQGQKNIFVRHNSVSSGYFYPYMYIWTNTESEHKNGNRHA